MVDGILIKRFSIYMDLSNKNMEQYINADGQNACGRPKETADETPRVRMLLSSQPNTPANVLDELANDEVQAVVQSVAENPHTSADTLARLAVHDNPRVRAAVAGNANMARETMWRLVVDVHPDVR